jgi:L-lactate dehydrogenase complex protein LldG
MSGSVSRENILKKIEEALDQPIPIPFPKIESNENVFKVSAEDEAVLFAESFTKLQGKFAFCLDYAEWTEQLFGLIRENQWEKIYCKDEPFRSILQKKSITLTNDLANCDVSVTGCEYLVARTGSIVMSTAQESGRTASVYAPIHVCVAFNHQVVYDLKQALEFIHGKYADKFPSLITFASGPSRTADIEKTLVTGVHGPKEVYCFLIEQT